MIETERLLLRDWRPEYFEGFVAATNTPEQLASAFLPWQEERGFTFWALERKSDRELLGFGGLGGTNG